MCHVDSLEVVLTTQAGDERSEPPENDVLAAHTRWWESLLAADVEALDGLLADTLTFHSPYGSVSSKSEILDNLRSGRLSYNSIDDPNPVVRTHGETGIVTGSADIQFQWESQPMSEGLYYTGVYGADSSGCRLLAWQSTQRAEDSV